MKIIRETDKIDVTEIAATAGFFDGVHRGHRFLIEELKQRAKTRHLPSAVVTFVQHPRFVLNNDYRPQLLNTFEEKMTRLETTGVDFCIVLEFTKELSELSAEAFIRDILCKRFHVKMLLVGYDHRFGHNRTDGFEQYVHYGSACGMEVLKAAPLSEGDRPVSSSEIRRLLEWGKIDEANEMLCTPYSIEGHIVSGAQVGRTIGFPTANIAIDDPSKIVPKIGVYAVRVTICGETHKGMLYIGSRPTLDDGRAVSMEVNIFDFSRDIYTDKIVVEFIHWVREDIRFESVEKLKEQLEKDRRSVNGMLL